MEGELKGTGKWTKEQSNIINGFFENYAMGRWEPQYKHPLFKEERFRSEGGFDRDWQEGELRKVVEERINPVVLENLIQCGKIKFGGLMVFLPRKTMDAEK